MSDEILKCRCGGEDIKIQMEKRLDGSVGVFRDIWLVYCVCGEAAVFLSDSFDDDNQRYEMALRAFMCSIEKKHFYPKTTI